MENQIFFFSASLLIICGIFLSYNKFASYIKLDKIFLEDFIKNKHIGITIGVLTLIFGILALLQPVGSILFLGDLLPALLAIIGGISLIARETSIEYKKENKFLLWLQSFVNTNISVIGLLMMAVGLLHAIFPTLVLL